MRPKEKLQTLNQIKPNKNIEVELCSRKLTEDCLPLPQAAGDAVLDYLEKVRPPINIDDVFLCLNAPYRPFSSSSAVSSLVASAIIRSGIDTPYSCGAHLLRHSAATEMLRSGAPRKRFPLFYGIALWI